MRLATRTPGILDLLVDGAKNKDIAKAFAVSPACVSKVRKLGIRKGLLPAQPRPPRRIAVTFDDHAVVKTLQAEAKRRDSNVPELMRQIIETVAKDGLFKAVLD